MEFLRGKMIRQLGVVQRNVTIVTLSSINPGVKVFSLGSGKQRNKLFGWLVLIISLTQSRIILGESLNDGLSVAQQSVGTVAVSCFNCVSRGGKMPFVSDSVS